MIHFEGLDYLWRSITRKSKTTLTFGNGLTTELQGYFLIYSIFQAEEVGIDKLS
jgi:hypothetical protein